MPKAFEECVRKGGRVRTHKPTKGTYAPICYDKAGSHAGEVKRTRKSSRKKR